MSDELMASHRRETLDHIDKVRANLTVFANILKDCGVRHDASKLREPEASIFAQVTPRLAALTYGSPEYEENMKDLGVALEHHYKHNSHHPEHYEDGIDGMNLFDLVEMFCDWLAATERHDDGNIYNSIIYSEKRFGMSRQLTRILWNTALIIGYGDVPELPPAE